MNGGTIVYRVRTFYAQPNDDDKLRDLADNNYRKCKKKYSLVAIEEQKEKSSCYSHLIS